MLKSFLNHIEPELTELKQSKSLLAVSGGRDSMVLWHLFESLKLPYSIAHCNFGLRGKESDSETQLVKRIAKERNTELFAKHFSSADYSQKESTQENARKLRYSFFDSLKIKHGFKRLVTAHHFMDQWEHFFIYLYRNNINTALSGIPSNIAENYRPLLKFTDTEIDNYAADNHVSYLQDSSNLETKYLRNKVRHWITPNLDSEVLESLNQANKTQARIQAELLRRFKSSCVFWVKDYWAIHLDKVSDNPYLKSQIQKTGLHHSLISKVLALGKSGTQIEAPSGFFAVSHELLVYSKALSKTSSQSISENQLPMKTTFGSYEVELEINSPKEFDKSKIYLNLSKIEWPLTMSSTIEGERIDLFGKGKSQKISDVFVNAKVPFFLRKTVPILRHGGTILSVADIKRSKHHLVEGNGNCLIISFKALGLLKQMMTFPSKK